MEILKKAKILAEAGNYDSCGPKKCQINVNKGLGGIYYAKAEHKTCKIFKTLMDNKCSFDCKYCQNRNGCTKNHASYQPNELVKIFNYLKKNLDVNGLFLSSAITGNPDKVTEKMISAVELLRNKHNFKGYIHFKILPGTSYDLIKQASKLSTRMSINLEAPNKSLMQELSNCKDFKTDILKRQSWISKMNLKGGQSTQIIITKQTSDKDVLNMVNWEYNYLNLRRIYYSAFQAVKGTPMQNHGSCSINRQNKLYNVDFLLRRYNFKLKDFKTIMDNGMLPKEDPKLALARNYFDKPIEINEASYEDLIKIPGIGPIGAKKILKTKINKLLDLKNLRINYKNASPFIKINGSKQTCLTSF